MTFLDYNAYINSAAWQAKRSSFLSTCARAKACCVCLAPYQRGFHVHHITYERLGRERFKDLALVCPDCHDKVHSRHKYRLAYAKGRKKTPPSLKSSTKRVQKSASEERAAELCRIKTREKQARKRAKRKADRDAKKQVLLASFPLKLTEAEIEAGRSQRGGFTRKQLARWGVSWPPVTGWKQALLEGKPPPVRVKRRELESLAEFHSIPLDV